MFRSSILFYYWRKILLNQFSPLFDHVNTIEQIKIVWWHIEIMLHILTLMYVLTSYCDEGDMYDSILTASCGFGWIQSLILLSLQSTSKPSTFM